MSIAFYTESLDQYLTEVRKLPKISKSEEVECFKKYKEFNDLEAIHKVITAHLRFVVYVAKQYRTYNVNFVDLIQEGNIALMKAAKNYNPEQYPNTRFISYAAVYIKRVIDEFLTKFKHLIKFSTTKSRRKLVQNSGKMLSHEFTKDNINNISRQLNVPENDVKEFLLWKNSIDVDIENEVILQELLYDKTEDLDSNKLYTILEDKLSILPEREIYIIRERYFEDNPKTYQELGIELGVSLQRVKQLELKSLKTLKELLKDYHEDI